MNILRLHESLLSSPDVAPLPPSSNPPPANRATSIYARFNFCRSRYAFGAPCGWVLLAIANTALASTLPYPCLSRTVYLNAINGHCVKYEKCPHANQNPNRFQPNKFPSRAQTVSTFVSAPVHFRPFVSLKLSTFALRFRFTALLPPKW